MSGSAIANPGELTRLMKPVGLVAGAFGASTAFIAGIMGPVGGGKTTECIAKGFRVGTMQNAVWDARRGCHVKKCRGAVVRDTYPNLDRTVIKSWHQWFPKTLGRWSGEAPRTHSFTLNVGRPGTRGYYQLDMEVIFTAIGDHAVEDVLRGLELTWLWLNEWDLLPKKILEVGVGRVGRYPGAMEGGCGFAQIFGDFNAPEEDNHTVKLFGIDQDGKGQVDPELAEALRDEVGDDRPLISFFRQPGGLEDGAENLHNLPPIIQGNPKAGRSYYLKQAALLPKDMKRRMIDNKLGPIRSGTPVYPEYSDDWHTGEFDPLPRVPFMVFADQGLLGAALLCQLDPVKDQLLVHDELCRVFENDDGTIDVVQIGGEAFGREVKGRMTTRFPTHELALGICDPAGGQGEEAINHRSWRQDFQKGLGIHVRKARVPGNAIDPRLKAVRDRLTATIQGEPRIRVHKRCLMLRKGFNTKYVWRRVSVGTGDGRFDSKPLKTQGYADLQDALQYGCFELEKGIELGSAGSFASPHGRSRQIQVESDYDMHGRA